MAEHPVIGERILRSIGGFAGAADIVRHEHESFDGSGYPDGLVGDEIPIGSRIILARRAGRHAARRLTPGHRDL